MKGGKEKKTKQKNKTKWYQFSTPVNWTIFAKFAKLWLSIFIKRKTLDGHRIPDNKFLRVHGPFFHPCLSPDG
jgi:hypothetical protein